MFFLFDLQAPRAPLTHLTRKTTLWLVRMLQRENGVNFFAQYTTTDASWRKMNGQQGRSRMISNLGSIDSGMQRRAKSDRVISFAVTAETQTRHGVPRFRCRRHKSIASDTENICVERCKKQDTTAARSLCGHDKRQA
jgi:hypothetical protein